MQRARCKPYAITKRLANASTTPRRA